MGPAREAPACTGQRRRAGAAARKACALPSISAAAMRAAPLQTIVDAEFALEKKTQV